jgi:hypothetical protein
VETKTKTGTTIARHLADISPAGNRGIRASVPKLALDDPDGGNTFLALYNGYVLRLLIFVRASF